MNRINQIESSNGISEKQNKEKNITALSLTGDISKDKERNQQKEKKRKEKDSRPSQTQRALYPVSLSNE